MVTRNQVETNQINIFITAFSSFSLLQVKVTFLKAPTLLFEICIFQVDVDKVNGLYPVE